MTIKVRLFASLQEKWGIEQVDLAAEGINTVEDVWQTLTGETWPRHILAAVNMDYVQSDAVVREGDEVAFFPPVTGG